MTAVICVSELTVKDCAFVPPKVTEDTLEKFVPVIRILKPPEVEPELGEIVVIVGAAT